MTMLRFDKGISAYGLQPEMLWALDRTVEVWNGHGIKYVTVTSGRGGLHGEKSLHNSGHASDVRRWEFDAQLLKEKVIPKLKKKLGDQFDVVLESNHIHIEFQPKGQRPYLTKLAA